MTFQDTKRLRILHVAESFSSGVFEVVRATSHQLSEDGHAVGIAYGRRPETPKTPADHLDPRVALFPLPWTRRRGRTQLAAARALRRLAAHWRPDIVHLHSSFAGAIGALTLPRELPTVYSPHAYAFTRQSDSGLRRFLYRLAERIVSARVDLIGAVSESEGALARHVARARRVAVVPNGISDLDPNALPEPRERLGRPLVVAMGRDTPQSQPDRCAQILTAVTDCADVMWVGAVAHPRRRTFERAGIRVTGWLPREEAVELLAKATAYLHYTAWDGLPIVVLEAMARDVAVVASDIPANREVLGTGQVCSTEEHACRLLRSVLTDQARRDGILRDQRRRRSAFASQRMAGQWVNVYRNVLIERER